MVLFSLVGINPRAIPLLIGVAFVSVGWLIAIGGAVAGYFINRFEQHT
jgi:hypothetical protein